MATDKLTQTAYADHLRDCADLAIEITARMNIHEDAARQATFATVIINAERHNIFMEPVPRDTSTPVAVEPVKVTEQASGKPAGGYEALVPEKNQGALKQPTPEQAEAGAVKALKDGVKRACQLLNQAGLTPALKPTTLDGYIKKETELGKSYAELDSEDLEALIKNLSFKLEELKGKNKTKEAEAGF